MYLQMSFGSCFFGVVAILQVFLAEALHHKTLFSPGLQPKGKPADQNADKTTYPASLERRAEHPQQDAAVDGVADDAIGTHPHERVPIDEAVQSELLDSHPP
jgi:hypothetical protein